MLSKPIGGMQGAGPAMQTCSNGSCKRSTTSFVKKNVVNFYKRCDPCRGSGHAKRDAANAAKAAALQARKDTGELLQCQDCGWNEADAFTPKADGTMPSRCDECVVKRKARDERYKHGEAGKVANKRYDDSEAGKARTKRFRDNRTERRRASPSMRHDVTILSASRRLVTGRYDTSPTFLKRTGWTGDRFRAHVRAVCVAKGLDFDDREAWELEHKIPRGAYDFNDPDDVLRCWSAANVHVMTPAENKQKSWHLLDDWVASAGVKCFPAAWMGKSPTENMKKAHSETMQEQEGLFETNWMDDDEFEPVVGDPDEFDSDHPVEQGEASSSGMQGAGSSE